MERTPGPQFFQLDSAPTPSDDWLLERLLSKRSNRKSKRAKILSILEKTLKSGLHVYQFWNSSADDAFNSDIRIYLTVDNTVYPWLISYDEFAVQKPFRDYIKQLNSPVVTYSDIWTTVCTNLGWKSGRFVSTVTGVDVNVSDYMVTVRQTQLEAFPISGTNKTADKLRRLDYEFVSLDGVGGRRQMIYAMDPKDMLNFVESTAYTNQYIQDYIIASEQNVDNDNIIDENRIGPGWKLAFYGMIAFRCPQNFNPDEELTNILWTAGRKDLIAVRFDGSNNNIQTPLQIGQGYMLETNQFNFVLFLDTYQAYIYSSLDKKVEDLYQKFGVQIKREKILVNYNQFTIQQIPGYLGVVSLYKWFTKQIFNFSKIDSSFGGYSGLYYSKYGKRWLYVELNSLNAILQYLYNTSPVNDQQFKTVTYPQSQNTGEQQNDPSNYGQGTHAFDFSTGGS